MSLKAKIEAVIYAAEEPVTFAQIVGLLAHEAEAELNRLASAQHSLALEELPPSPSEPDLLNEEILALPSSEEEGPELTSGEIADGEIVYFSRHQILSGKRFIIC